MRATDVLMHDHELIRTLFLQLEQSASGEERRQLLGQIAEALELHARLEEELFYPAVSRVSARVGDCRSSHQHVRRLLATAQGLDPDGDEFLSGARTLKSAVLSHLTEEEGAIFFEAARLGAVELEHLGWRIRVRRAVLTTARLERNRRDVNQASRKIARAPPCNGCAILRASANAVGVCA